MKIRIILGFCSIMYALNILIRIIYPIYFNPDEIAVLKNESIRIGLELVDSRTINVFGGLLLDEYYKDGNNPYYIAIIYDKDDHDTLIELIVHGKRGDIERVLETIRFLDKTLSIRFFPEKQKFFKDIVQFAVTKNAPHENKETIEQIQNAERYPYEYAGSFVTMKKTDSLFCVNICLRRGYANQGYQKAVMLFSYFLGLFL